MKIIKEGLAKGDNEHEGTCVYCNCKVRFKQKEATYKFFPRNESCWTIKCPTHGCGATIYVDAN